MRQGGEVCDVTQVEWMRLINSGAELRWEWAVEKARREANVIYSIFPKDDIDYL